MIAEPVRMPTPATLKKYGLSGKEWLAILKSQGYKCPICGGVPSTGRWVIDHKHVRNYKKLPDEKRKSLVRGILCWRCNYYFAGKGMNHQWAVNLTNYFWRFENK